MKQRILLLLSLLLLCMPQLASAEVVSPIKNFVVEDIPYDDGSGLSLRWEPLPKSTHIIEYRIYRGTAPKQLFFIGKIDVDPVAGISGKTVYFYDKDYRDFVTVNSPASLKKDNHLGKNTPLYDMIPRDPKVFGPMIKDFTLLATIPKKHFYFDSQKVKDENGEVKAGLKWFQFGDAIYANPIAGKRYYYTVVAVTESRKYLPMAPIASAIPVDNAPEGNNPLYPFYISDLKQLNFEWSIPLYKSDIVEYRVYALPKGKEAAFAAYQKELQDIAKLMEASQLKPTKANTPQPRLSNPAQLIAVQSNPLSPISHISVPIVNGAIVNAKAGINFHIDPTSISNYSFVLGMPDYYGYESFSTIAAPRLGNKAALPMLPAFDVRDKPDDKGDYNELSFGKPLAYMTQGYFTSQKHNELFFNYEISTNSKYVIDHVFFKFLDKNNKIVATHTEFFPDNMFKLKLPEAYKHAKEFKIQIGFKTRKTPIGENFYITQILQYNHATRTYINKEMYYGKENLTQFHYQVLRRSLTEGEFQYTKSVNTTVRSYDDAIPYETVVVKGVSGWDKKTNLLLVDPTLDIAWDEKSNLPVMTPLFADEVQASVKKYQDQIKQMQAEMAKAPATDKAAYQAQIDQLQALAAMQTTNPILAKANAIKNQKARIKYLAAIREKNLRSYSYRLVKSDGMGNFVETPIFKSKSGAEYIMPLPNWFDTTKGMMVFSTFFFLAIVVYLLFKMKTNPDFYIRPIAGLEEIDNAVGRATEMGRPILYVPGLSGIGDMATIASLAILGKIAKKTAEYDTRLLVPNCDYFVLPLAQEIVREAHIEAGRPDSYDQANIFFVADSQFPYVAGINGTMIREKTATNFYMGTFYAEALLMTETGNATGAIQIAGTDALTQVPFFITTCDYTLIGEELYAASAYMSRDPDILSTLKAQDYVKFFIIAFIVLGTILTTMHMNGLIFSFPTQ